MLQTLREDFAKLPELLAQGAPEQPAPAPAVPAEPEPSPEPVADGGQQGGAEDQLGLF